MTQQLTPKSLGLYVHIPFCPYRCRYCDFVILTGRQETIPDYIQAIAGDLENFSSEYPDYEIKSVYFGGGTPSLLDAKHYDVILSCVSRFFGIQPNLEISLESNPETLTLEKLAGYRTAGINRLSLGVQAVQEKHLWRMGRAHDAAKCDEVFRMARKSGFDNISVDLLFGLPNQSTTEWEETLERTFAWKPQHVSAYGLQVETGTQFWNEAQRGNLPVPPDEIQAQMYETLLKACEENNCHQYEISNFAMTGFECRHNLIYWKNEEYLGVGLGAVSYINGKRSRMTRSLTHYLSGEERIVDSENLSMREQMGEALMLGLRLRRGVSSSQFQDRFGRTPELLHADAIARYRDAGLLTVQEDRLFLTEKGMLLSNEVLQAFV